MRLDITINGTITVNHQFPAVLKVAVTEPAEEAQAAERLAAEREKLSKSIATNLPAVKVPGAP